MKWKLLNTCLLVLIFATACSTTRPVPELPQTTTTASRIQAEQQMSPTPTDQSSTPTAETQTAEPVITEVMPSTTPTFPVPTATYQPGSWRNFPVIPVLDERVKQVYNHGLDLGNNPQAFSKIGDCGSTPAWFLGDFDRGENHYRLGAHQYLDPVIQEFQGSFDRTSLAAKSGFNTSSIFAPLWANREMCLAEEGPLACEYRVHRPIFAFIMLGSNDVWHPDEFEPQMRRLIEFSIDQGVVPILSTKVDNIEGDGSINDTIARLSLEYGVPLWNYWQAVQPLPDGGLQDDQVHLTWAPNRFDDPQAMKAAWPVRNLTALQVLDHIWRFVAAP